MAVGIRYRSFFVAGIATIFLLVGLAAWDHSTAIKKVPTTHRLVALTFDDGPHPITTPALLEVLSAKKVRATFFALGNRVARHPDLAARVVNSGHELASHSYTHRYLNRLTKEELDSEMDESEKAFAAAGAKPVLIRPPGGGYNDAMVAQLRQRGYTTVLWSVDPRDWDGRAAGQIVESVVKGTEPGSIILLHEGDCAAATPAALEVIVDRLRADGYEFVTVSELLQYYEVRQ